MIWKHINNRMKVKTNDFGLKYGNQKKITEKQMDKKYDKTITRAQRRPESGIKYWFTQNKTKKNIKLENVRPRWITWFLVQ